MKKCFILYLGVMLLTLACNNGEKKQLKFITPRDSVVPATTVISPNPIKECSKVLQGKKIHNVSVYFDQVETGTGGAYKDKGKWYLVTASHVFPSGRTGYYTIIINNDTLYVAKAISGKDDAVIMQLSSKKNSFKGFSLYKNDVSQKTGWTFQMLFKKVGGEKIFSLCGEEYEHVGFLANQPGFVYAALIVKKHSLPGESGTVFYDENGNLYVMSQQYMADDDPAYQIHGIGKDEQISLLRPIGFGIAINETGKQTIVPW